MLVSRIVYELYTVKTGVCIAHLTSLTPLVCHPQECARHTSSIKGVVNHTISVGVTIIKCVLHTMVVKKVSPHPFSTSQYNIGDRQSLHTTC